jgi:hypothetical protein
MRRYSTKKYKVKKEVPNTLDKCQYCWNPVENTHHVWIYEYRKGYDLITGSKLHYECVKKWVNYHYK